MRNGFCSRRLIFQAAYCSNTSGVFKAYHRGWGGSTNTALYRIRSKLAVEPPIFLDNKQRNEVYQEDANGLVSDIKCDIAYVDPPYNQHQYGSNYHLLNTIDLWDKPEVNKEILIDGKTINKSAIRRDWRTERRSPYCYRDTAPQAFRDLIERLKARYILISYSTDGLIGFDALLDMFARKGRLDVVTRRYKRYRVSSQRYSGVDVSDRGYNTEFVMIVDTARRCIPSNVSRIRSALQRAVEPKIIDRLVPAYAGKGMSMPGGRGAVVKIAFRSDKELTPAEERRMQGFMNYLKTKL